MDRIQQKRINTFKLNNGHHAAVLIDELERVTDTLEEFCEQLDSVSGVTIELRGPQGIQGPMGPAGKDGKDGKSIVGPAGKDGKDGKDGKSIVGPRGPAGKDGAPGPQGLRGEQGIPGLPGKIPAHRWEGTKLQFQNPDETWGPLVDLKGKEGKGKKGGGGGKSTLYYDLTSQCNGVTKTFTVPANTRILSVHGTQFPQNYRPDIDWTGSGTTTLTLTSEVGAPETGQTLFILYVEA